MHEGVGAPTSEVPRRRERPVQQDGASLSERREQFAAEAGELGMGLGRDLVARPRVTKPMVTA